jgi:small nuclear ribonucleoprotein (snRNP)-like protein
MAVSFQLGSILHELRGMQVTIGLRDDATVCGVIEEADDAMNTTLSDVKLTPSDGGAPIGYSLLYVRGRQVRWLNIPDEVDVLSTLQQRDARGLRSMRAFRTHKRRDKAREQAGRSLPPTVLPPAGSGPALRHGLGASGGDSAPSVSQRGGPTWIPSHGAEGQASAPTQRVPDACPPQPRQSRWQ